jgi:hypothetical protein
MVSAAAAPATSHAEVMDNDDIDEILSGTYIGSSLSGEAQRPC